MYVPSSVGLPPTGAVAAIIEDKTVKTQFIEDIYRVERIGDISAVAVAEKQCKLRVLCGNIPAGQDQSVRRFELNLFIFQPDVAGIIGYLAGWTEGKGRLHKVQHKSQPKIGYQQ